jgi:alkyl hydroperoxide reductase subunit AhpC
MSLRLNDEAPNFNANTTQGPINFHDWIGDSWAILFSHPKDFTPVCTTELGYMAKIEPEFTRRNTKLIGLSVDPVENHKSWAKDIEETQGFLPNYPMIGDENLAVSKLYNMLPAEESGASQGRTAATNATVRAVFIISPDKKIRLMLTYPMTTGRNFDEVLRVLDSMQLTQEHKVATPVNWKQGDDVIIAGSVSDEDAKKLFPEGWTAVKSYLRMVKQPQTAQSQPQGAQSQPQAAQSQPQTAQSQPQTAQSQPQTAQPQPQTAQPQPQKAQSQPQSAQSPRSS